MAWRPPVDLSTWARIDPVVKRWAPALFVPLLRARLRFPRAVIHSENIGVLHGEPLIVATNHNHYFDWVPVRLPLCLQGRHMCSFTKPRAYERRFDAWFLNAVGVVPIVSKGYLLSADLRLQRGRRPDEAEYAALRAIIDGRRSPSQVPDELRGLLSTPRDVLGLRFEPAVEPYADFMRRLFQRMSAEMLSLAGRALEAGNHFHLMPQGCHSARLTAGRSGVVQIAAAVGRPIVPVGISGMRRVFPDPWKLRSVGGTITVRYGEPYRVSLPRDHVPFEWASEQRNAAALQEATSALMERINALLDPDCQWSDDPESDAIQGVDRFMR